MGGNKKSFEEEGVSFIGKFGKAIKRILIIAGLVIIIVVTLLIIY